MVQDTTDDMLSPSPQLLSNATGKLPPVSTELTNPSTANGHYDSTRLERRATSGSSLSDGHNSPTWRSFSSSLHRGSESPEKEMLSISFSRFGHLVLRITTIGKA